MTTFAIGGTIEADDVFRVQVGNKIVDITGGSTSAATVVANIVTAWLALDETDYPEFAEITPSASTTTLVLTAATPGRPFTATITPLEANLSAADAQTVEGAGVATTGTTSTASAGPEDWSTAANWSTGAVPVTGDSVYLEDSDDDVKYGLAQSGVTLALLEIRASFTGTLGLPLLNEDATEYPEYRDRHLTIGATAFNVGQGPGEGSGRLLVSNSNIQTTLTVFGTASALDADHAALQWKGTHASNVVNVYAGSVDVARYGGETATIATLRVEGDAAVYCTSGVTLTTISQAGGTLEINSAATTITLTAGELTVKGSGAITTITNNGGSIVHMGTGTVTTYVGAGGSSIDHTQAMLAKTFTNVTFLSGCAWNDDLSLVTYTNGCVYSRCRVQDCNVSFGVNRTVTPS